MVWTISAQGCAEKAALPDSSLRFSPSASLIVHGYLPRPKLRRSRQPASRTCTARTPSPTTEERLARGGRQGARGDSLTKPTSARPGAASCPGCRSSSSTVTATPKIIGPAPFPPGADHAPNHRAPARHRVTRLTRDRPASRPHHQREHDQHQHPCAVRPPITVPCASRSVPITPPNCARSLPEARQTAPEPSQCAPCCDVAPQACQPKQTQTHPAISARKASVTSGRGGSGMGVRDVSHVPRTAGSSAAGYNARPILLVPTLEVRKTRARGESGTITGSIHAEP